MQNEWRKLKNKAEETNDRLQELQAVFKAQLKEDMSLFGKDLDSYYLAWKTRGPCVDGLKPRLRRGGVEAAVHAIQEEGQEE